MNPWTSKTLFRALGLGLCLTTLSVPALSADAKGGKTYGFVLYRFYPAIYRNEDNCPDGQSFTPQQSFLSQITPAERARLERPENAKEYEEKYKYEFASGEKGLEMCRTPEIFKNNYKHPPQHSIKGKLSYGMNLDGDDGSGAPPQGICKHGNFEGPTGEKGIDNQLFRAEGCQPYFRPSLTDPNILPGADYFNRLLKEGLHTIVMEVRGVDDPINDDAVEVGIYSSHDKPVMAGQALIPNASLTITENPRWQHVFKGKIVNGEIVTEVRDLTLNMEWSVGGERGAKEEYDLRRSRFKLRILANGELDGFMGAYQPLLNSMSIFRIVGAGTSAVAGIECAAEYNALQEHADGYPDPVTGQCTAISLAYEVKGVPAFIIHPDPKPAKPARTAQN